MDDINKKKNDFISYCLTKDNSFPNYLLPRINIGCKLEAVFIEFRLLPYTIFIIKNAILKLGSGWSYTIICGNNNFDFYNNFKKEYKLNLKIIKLNLNNITREEYSILLLNSNFYNHFLGEYILIYQEDSIIFKNFDNKFLEYDYIGAPYFNKEIGNGGFSLRNKRVMKIVCKRFFDENIKYMEKNVRLLKELKTDNDFYKSKENLKYYKIEQSIIEDIQITNRMKNYNIGNLPDFETGKEFSIEKYYHPKAFGGHQFWFTIKDVKLFLDEKLGY